MRKSAMHERDANMQTVMFQLTDGCNLKCSYCYEDTISWHGDGEQSTSALSPNRPTRMNPDLIKRIIVEHMTQADFDAVSFDFFGGEALLEFETIRTIVEWFHSREWKKRHRFTISTNGTLLTDEIKEWLTHWKSCVIPLLSLDGTRESHNKGRSNSYDHIAPHFGFFQENWPEQSVRMTIGPHNIGQTADGMIHMHALGFNAEASIRFEDVWGDPASQWAYAEIYAAELMLLVDYYIDQDQFDVPFFLGKDLGVLCLDAELEDKFCGAGKYMTCYTPDGESYPCQLFIPLSTSNPATDPYTASSSPKPETQPCDECLIRPLCPTCEGFNWSINSHIAQRTSFHCTFIKLQVLASIKLYLGKLKQRLPEGLDQSDEGIKMSMLGIHKFMNSQAYRDIEPIIDTVYPD